jgi:hypothetical protein
MPDDENEAKRSDMQQDSVVQHYRSINSCLVIVSVLNHRLLVHLCYTHSSATLINILTSNFRKWRLEEDLFLSAGASTCQLRVFSSNNIAVCVLSTQEYA